MRGAPFSLLPLLFFSFHSLLVSAVQLRIQRPSHASSATNNNLINKNNERYTANITISGRVVNVALDTGSTDLWVMPPEGLPTFNDTKLNATLRYGDGTDYVTGDVGVGKFELAQYTIPFQAFLNVFDAASAEDPDFQDGIFGLWGLGFNTPGSSGVNDAVQEAYGANQNWGQSVLANIFDQNPTGSDYIGISLSRTGDQEGTADASLTISEYDSDYASVQSAPKLTQFPANSGAWTVVLDALVAGGKKLDWQTTMATAPAGKNVVHLDTGTTNVMVPGYVVDAIYSSIPGAVLTSDFYVPATKFSTTNDVWVVPCNATVEMQAVFGGQNFSIHPLDLTDIQTLVSPDGTRNYTVCVGTFTDVGTIVDGASDALFGDSFLRNVYSVFDFGTGGSTKGNPFVQLLSNTDATKSAADLVSVRKQTMASLPAEVAPIELVMIMNGTKTAGKTGSPIGGGNGGSSSGSGSSGSSGSSGNSNVAFTSSASVASMVSLVVAVLFWSS
ncbi:aspartic peptidase domain-containing protein [Mycena sp. CBHHK59/15]|nr:aspartic peptidase domain-containing protein [Mycena sp. CBHHK59/15]